MESILDRLDEESPQTEAEYTLEVPIRCNGCGEKTYKIQVIRLLRTKVNFTSSLPRRGYIVICPLCETAIPAHLG